MDDALEIPISLPPKTDLKREGDDELSSDEEDDGLDWTKLLPVAARPVIPRRGEKEFEPRDGGGTNLQLHVLDRARSAMFDTLRAQRTISSKLVSSAIWHPGLSRTEVTVARGIHLSNMGHSAPRTFVGKDGIAKIQKRLELLPEEAIYLIERGSLFCWKYTGLNLGEIPGLTNVSGFPMTVQQAFSEMVGKEDLTLEKFQVYAYLKRLGYVVTRSQPPDSYYPVPGPVSVLKPVNSVLQRIKSLFPLFISTVSRTILGGFNWLQPVRISRWLHHDKNYASLFRSLRFMQAGHAVPLRSSTTSLSARSSSPYRIFYNLYKPSTPFRKSAPPLPDFQIVVINGRTTPMPTLQELTDLFDILPETPIPPPRQRQPQTNAPLNVPSVASNPSLAVPPSEPITTNRKRNLFLWLFRWPRKTLFATPARPINPFPALKTGKKIVIIAVVDASNISFFRFGQGEFKEWPMI